MRLAYITRGFPFDQLGETFLQPEVQELAMICESLYVIPTRPQLRAAVSAHAGAVNVRIPMVGPWTLGHALLETLCNPLLTWQALRMLLFSKYRFSAKLKNILVFPKALALARYVRAHRIEHIHAHWLTTPATVGYVVSILTGIPWSCTAHSHDIFADNLILEKTSHARFIRIISHRNRGSLESLTHGHARSMLRVIHMGVAIKGDLSRTVKSDRPTRLLCPARLDPCKGHADLLQALAILRQRGFPFHCNLAGNGPLYKSVKAMIDGLNLSDCVTIRGLVPYDNLIQELRNGYYDAVVLPSVEDSSVSTIYEGIPVALMEAMEAGIPCVSTRIGSIPELINSENGILVEQHRPHDLAEALTKMADVNLREKLGQAARRYIIRDFNAVTTTKTLYELMRRELVANPVQTVRSTRTVAGSQHAN